MACRLPGAPSVDELKRALFEGSDLVTEIPRSRWSKEAFFHPQVGTRGKAYTFAAGVIDDIWSFDTSLFAISAREASQMDPQQRILLQVVWEALEDSGLAADRLAGQKIGVFVGSSAMGHGTRLSRDALVADAYMMTGNTLSLVSNRISHALDLRGPSLTVDTACSSSLFALDLAQQALERDEIDTAIVAGVNMLLDPSHFIGFSAARMLSPTGRCRPFSADADGYVRAEGAVAFVLERKSAAALLPRRAYARLLGVATNSDGRTINVALPALEGQRDLLDRLYGKAGVDPASLAFVEAHGTGTQAGDPIEAAALGQVLGRARTAPLSIGSIKSNIGHLEPASGVAGMLKAMIAFEERALPPTLHCEKSNPNIDLAALNLTVVSQTQALAGGRPLRAGISSFGFGGANAHAILEAVSEPVANSETPRRKPATAEAPILMVSAACQTSLRGLLSDWSARIARNTHLPEGAAEGLAEDAAAARAYRALLPVRSAVLCDDPAQVAMAMAAAAEGEGSGIVIGAESRLKDAPPVFLYSGNGSQYAGMGRAALASDKPYAAALRRIDKLFRELSGWSIIEALRSPTLQQDLRDCDIAQPLLFADQIALTTALAARGLVPAAVMGHSGGEVAAAHVSGALDLPQALRLIHQRSLSQRALRGRGAMAALSQSVAAAEASLAEFGGSITIAAENSPNSVTLVGTPDEIDAYVGFARRTKRWACVKLPIDYPYHAPMQDEVLGDLKRAIAGLTVGPTKIPLHSSVLGRVVQGQELTVDYWCANVRQPVQFKAAMDSLKASGHVAFLEIGPSPVLGGYVTSCLAGEIADIAVLHSFEKSDTVKINPVRRTLARAMVHGLRIEDGPFTTRPRGFDRSLPRYPWHNEVYRVDVTPAINAVYGSGEDFHRLLGLRDAEDSTAWRCDVDLGGLPEMEDHRVGTQVLLPAMGFAEMALLAAQRTLKTEQVELRDLDIVAPVVLTMGSFVVLRTGASPAQSMLAIDSRARGDEGAWRDHMRTRFFRGQPVEAARTAPIGHGRPVHTTGDEIYAAAAEIGLNYGPRFRRVDRIFRPAQDVFEVFLNPGQPFHSGQDGFAFDFIGADAICHGMIAAVMGTDRAAERQAYVPVRIGRLILVRAGAPIASGRIALRRIGQRSMLADFTLFDADGAEIARMDGVRFQVAGRLRGLNLALHAFTTQTLPVSETLALPTLTLEAAAVLATDARFSPGDDAYFFVQAVAQRIAYEAAQSQGRGGASFGADGAGDMPATISPGGMLSAAMQTSPYAAAVFGMLERADLASRTGSGWQLARVDDDLPSAAALLQSLLVDRPDLGPEAAILARLHEVLPRLLTAGESDPQAEFGASALANLAEGSVFAQRSRAYLARLVRSVVKDWPAGASLRIAEVSDGRTQVIPKLLASDDCGAAAFWDLRAECFGAAAAALPLPPDRVQTIDATAEALEGAPLFHLILVPETLAKARDPLGLLKLLAGRLAPSGQLIALTPQPSDFGDLVHGMDADWFSDTLGFDMPVSRMLSKDETLRLARKAGLDLAEASFLTEGMGGPILLLASAPPVARLPIGSAALRAAVRLVVTGEPELSVVETRAAMGEQDSQQGADAPVLIRNQIAGLRYTRPIGQDNAVVMWFDPEPSADPSARIARRLLVLRDLLEGTGGNPARIIAVIPGGSASDIAGRSLPEQTAVWAALRTAENEYPRIKRVCIDPVATLEGVRLANRVAAAVAQGASESEFVLTDDGVHALRVMRGLSKHTDPEQTEGRAVLETGVWSGLDEIAWTANPRRKPGPGEIEVEVAATGLNYRDIMWAMGLLPEEALEKGFAGPTIGIECSGRVVAVGPAVSGFAIGDPVVTFGPSSFASHVTVAADFAAPLPDGIDLVAAATLPVAFFTAHYGLVHLAQLAAGETVLIHGGAGGVGLAAIQIAQARGARVIATAGSAVKRAVLARLGVDQVLDSRSLAFSDQVMRLTQGRGADVVLNAIAGKGMEASLFCTAPFGRFIELGKQDFYANTAIGLRPMKENISYFGVDVDQLITARPDLFRRLFAEMMAGFASGALRPLPMRVFDGEAAVDAFRLMQKSGHLGKVVIRPRAARGLPAKRPARLFRANPNGAHVIIGGTGGLGVEVAQWLVRRGARRLVLVGRTAKATDTLAGWIRQCRAKGVSVELAACDVADETALGTLLAAVREAGPIAGIIHSAMLLDDMPMKDLTPEGLAQTLGAKVSGGANLDRLTRQDALDYFVLFSSIATLIGNHGQSSYVAANGFLEGLARSRRLAGLPGLAIGWGAISDVGHLTRETAKAAFVARMSGNVQMTARDVTLALDRVMSDSAPQEAVLHITPMRWTASASALKTLADPMHRLLWNLGRSEGDRGDDKNLRETLLELPRAKAEEKLAAFLVGRIAHILHVSEAAINVHRPTTELGMDSLMGVELGLTLQESLGNDLPVAAVSEGLSIAQISARIVGHLTGGTADETGAAAGDAGNLSLMEQHIKAPASTVSRGGAKT